MNFKKHCTFSVCERVEDLWDREKKIKEYQVQHSAGARNKV